MARMSKQAAEAIEILQALSDHAYRLYCSRKSEGKEAEATAELERSIAYDEAIWLLTDKEYKQAIRDIFL